ncbi:MAG TPA: phosphatidylcholine/phosphatidylserine synthase [Pyrinomonadaceae bacterium]|nr:phosphatidylcholine/phosphatidylserine synthase [Pyrinomonadaceae bacterium]
MTGKAEVQVEEEPKNPERRGLRKGVYLIPSVFTAANIGMGFYAVMAAARGFQVLGGGTEGDLLRASYYLDSAARAIGWAVLFDMLDGRLARMTKTTTEIGVQLDSIADVVTFGLAPAVLAYVWGYGATLKEGSDLHSLAWFLSFMYLMCGAFRLARFNVQASRPRILAEGTPKVDKKSFVGLPIPVAGGLIAAIIHFAPLPLVNYGPERAQVYSLLLMTLVGVLSVLMVSTLRFSSFKTVGTRSRGMRTIILAVGLGMLIFLYSRYVLLALCLGYILNGLVQRIFGMFRRRPEIGEANIQPKLN